MGQVRTLLAIAAGTEMLSGLTLIVRPSLLPNLLFGSSLSGAGEALAPLAGLGLLALAIVCWPTVDVTAQPGPALRAMLFFNAASALYLAGRALWSAEAGPLALPAAAFHGLLAAWLARVWLRGRYPARS